MEDAGARSWRWFRVKVMGLLTRPPGWRSDGQPIPSTRLGIELNPPPPPQQQ